MNRKLQTRLQDCGHVTFLGLQFAFSQEKPNAKDIYWVALSTV